MRQRRLTESTRSTAAPSLMRVADAGHDADDADDIARQRRPALPRHACHADHFMP